MTAWALICPREDVTESGSLELFRHGTASPCFTDVCISVALYVHVACTAYSLGEKSNSEFCRLPRNWRLRSRRIIMSVLMALPVLYLMVVQLLQGERKSFVQLLTHARSSDASPAEFIDVLIVRCADVRSDFCVCRSRTSRSPIRERKLEHPVLGISFDLLFAAQKKGGTPRNFRLGFLPYHFGSEKLFAPE